MQKITPAVIICLWMVILLNRMDAKNNTDDASWSVRMAESVMSRHPNGYGDWDYVTGTVLRGFEELWRTTGDSQYFDYIKKTVDRAVTATGGIRDYSLSSYNIDEIKEGCNCLFLCQETVEEKYKKAADLLRSQLEKHPRTNEGGFWHKQRYPWQMWLDGLYMGAPFYAQYSLMFDDSAGLDDAASQFIYMENHARDSDTGLLYHGWDESGNQDWADPVTGCSASFWGRAIGWYAMALVDVLDFIPLEHQKRDSLVAILQRLTEAMVQFQDETGVWWQVVDQDDREGNYLESSVSCMMVYAIAKGIRMGYLDHSYQQAVEKGYQGILDEFITENSNGTINLNHTCITAGLGNGRDGTYQYYVYETSQRSNDGKGVGPFITASLEVERMATSILLNDNLPLPGLLSLGNRPNPFNPSTTIHYSVSNAGPIKLTIFNLRGEPVAQWEKSFVQAGIYSQTFDASSLESGVYISELISGRGRITESMVLIK
ncbi:glycoside hydrolase family 88 protein [bacterium]|nr:glycoside hydrolase family 88 protein [bacterium]